LGEGGKRGAKEKRKSDDVRTSRGGKKGRDAKY